MQKRFFSNLGTCNVKKNKSKSQQKRGFITDFITNFFEKKIVFYL